ncbi:unnamed protein product, partial [marine sediment metagenome]
TPGTEPGIHSHRRQFEKRGASAATSLALWLWIPGSALRAAPE